MSTTSSDSFVFHTKRYIKCKKYVEFGLVMLPASILLMLLHLSHKDTSINASNLIIADTCSISTIEIKTIVFNCWDDVNPNIVEMPCVKILSKTKNGSMANFYRNIAERSYAHENKADVCY